MQKSPGKKISPVRMGRGYSSAVHPPKSWGQIYLRLLCVYLGHVLAEVDQLVGITPLVVVPGNQLYEVVVQGNACVCIEDAGMGIMIEVGGYYLVLGVIYDALETVALGSSLHGGLDLIVGSGLLQAAGKVYNGYVGSRYAHGQTGNIISRSQISMVQDGHRKVLLDIIQTIHYIMKEIHLGEDLPGIIKHYLI